MSICKLCNTNCVDASLFCHNCGTKIEKQLEPEPPRIPRAMTVKEAAQTFFQGRVSAGAIYAAIRECKLPHVKISSGKILLDVDELTKWWESELKKSRGGGGKSAKEMA